MQKIRCPRCGVVNLEKFVTFPQCAGCGSTLTAPRAAPLPFWRRPLGAFLWVSIIGLVIAGLIASVSLLATAPDNQAQIVVYGNASRRAALRQTVIINMTVDTVGENNFQQRAPLKAFKLRLPRKTFKNLAFVSLDPKPDAISSTKGGRYFHYDSLPRETTLHLRLYAVSSGQQRFRADFYATDHLPGSYNATVTILPNTAANSS